MKKQGLATFQVHIESIENNTWQGEVSFGDETFHFQSEIQLLRWMCEKCPAIAPEMNGFSASELKN